MIDGGLVNRRVVPRPPGVPVGCRRVVFLGRGASGGRKPGRRCASIDLPAPGGPIIRKRSSFWNRH